MQFTHGQTTFDTTQMISFETGRPGVPYLFQSQCGAHVLVVTFDRTKGISMAYATAEDVAYYARTFGLPNLHEAYLQAHNPANRPEGTGTPATA